MLQEIHAIVEEIRKDDRVRSVILTGNGRAFCLCTRKIRGRENDKNEDHGAVGN
jgi:1,4-dihydroxy-2-naphthoyl-CoA synthase